MLVAIIFGAFLIGSIPFGVVIGRLFFRIDLRAQGSGNIGAANALRSLGRTGAAAVLILDALKGFVPTTIALAHFGPPVAFCAAIAAVLGHLYSPFLGFRGGKGVATSLGVTFAWSWIAGLAFVAPWIIVVLSTGYASLGSLVASLVALVALGVVTHSIYAVTYGAFSVALIIYAHRANIVRLRQGTENVIRFFGPRAV